MQTNNPQDPIHQDYSRLMNAKINEKVTMQDIAKCTGGGSSLQGKVVRFINRLIRLNKGWIDDAAVKNILIKVDKEKIDHITGSMQALAKKFTSLDKEKISQSKWDHEKHVSASVQELEKLHKHAIKFSDVARSLGWFERGSVSDMAVGLKAAIHYSKKDEKIFKPLRDLPPLAILQAPQCTLAKKFAEFLKTHDVEAKDIRNTDSLNVQYQDFISSLINEKEDKLTSREIKKLINEKELQQPLFNSALELMDARPLEKEEMQKIVDTFYQTHKDNEKNA